MQNKLQISKINKCTGCRICELACSYYHYSIFNPDLARIYIQKKEHQGIDQPLICYQCADYPCKEECPVQAFYKTKQGIINIDEEKCIGCGACAEACPYNAIRFSPISKKAIKCDLCGGEPQCVKWCPANVLNYGNVISLKRILTDIQEKGD